MITIKITGKRNSHLWQLAKFRLSGYQQAMKTVAFLLPFCLWRVPLSLVRNPKPIRCRKDPASEAKDHVNAETIVFGKVVELHKTEKLVRINLDKPFPTSPSPP